MIKGSGHHVIPSSSGWCVMSEVNRRVIAHFDSKEKAMAYAAKCAQDSEGCVLLHKTSLEHPDGLSTVDLPQEDDLPDFVHQTELVEIEPQPAKPCSMDVKVSEPNGKGFDPLLGFDEYYFEI